MLVKFRQLNISYGHRGKVNLQGEKVLIRLTCGEASGHFLDRWLWECHPWASGPGRCKTGWVSMEAGKEVGLLWSLPGTWWWSVNLNKPFPPCVAFVCILVTAIESKPERHPNVFKKEHFPVVSYLFHKEGKLLGCLFHYMSSEFPNSYIV